MKIIAHRGACSFATENTIEAIKKALDIGVDIIEIDVWTTKDNVPVLHHDPNLFRITGKKDKIYNITSTKLAKIKTLSGENIPTLEQVLKLTKGKDILIDINDYYLSTGLLKILKKYSGPNVSVCSSRHNLLLELKSKLPKINIYASTSKHPFRTIRFAARNQFKGMSLNYHHHNLLVYYLCRKNKLDLLLYTIDRKIIVDSFKLFKMTELGVITNRPEKFIR